MRRMLCLVAITLATIVSVLPVHSAPAPTQPQPVPVPAQRGYDDRKREANENSVSIVTSGIQCTCTRFADDMRAVLNDMSANGLRILPVIGVGGAQNLKDILFLRGVDAAVVDQDVLNRLKEKDPELYKSAQQRINYITKLYNSEFHILARTDIAALSELAGKKINIQNQQSHTAIAAEVIFKLTGVEFEPTHYDDSLALEKMRSGEIAAMAILTGAPRASLASIRKDEGFHFIGIDSKSAGGRDLSELYQHYLPAHLTSDFYPNLIEPGQTIPTVANRAVLAVYAWPEGSERYNRVSKFVKKFFDNYSKFQDTSRHIKWREVNLAAELHGWTRFKAAQEWLAARGAGGSQEDRNAEVSFEKYVKQATHGKDAGKLSAEERNALFKEFRKYWEARREKGQ